MLGSAKQKYEMSPRPVEEEEMGEDTEAIISEILNVTYEGWNNIYEFAYLKLYQVLKQTLQMKLVRIVHKLTQKVRNHLTTILQMIYQ